MELEYLIELGGNYYLQLDVYAGEVRDMEFALLENEQVDAAMREVGESLYEEGYVLDSYNYGYLIPLKQWFINRGMIHAAISNEFRKVMRDGDLPF